MSRTAASMGPWLCSHGNSPTVFTGPSRYTASMGPWLCSHGNKLRNRDLVRAGLASMGPWLCSHGNAVALLPTNPTHACFNGAVAV